MTTVDQVFSLGYVHKEFGCRLCNLMTKVSDRIQDIVFHEDRQL